jgi:hypothetical protein
VFEEQLLRPPGTMDAFLIDEIGKMECHCPQFVATMRRLLGEPTPWSRPSLFGAADSSPRSSSAVMCRSLR